MQVVVAKDTVKLDPIRKIFVPCQNLSVYSFSLYKFFLHSYLLFVFFQLILFFSDQKLLDLNQVRKLFLSCIQLYLIEQYFELDSIAADGGEHIDLDIDILDDGKEFFTVQERLSTIDLLSLTDISHVELRESEWI